MAINKDIQNLINSNRKLSSTDVKNLFYYFYGRDANASEISYWTKKTSKQLSDALTPNASQFTNAGYYKDVVTPAKVVKSTPVHTPTTTPAPTSAPAETQPTIQQPSQQVQQSQQTQQTPPLSETADKIVNREELDYLISQGLTENDITRIGQDIYLTDAVNGKFAIPLRSFRSRIDISTLPPELQQPIPPQTQQTPAPVATQPESTKQATLSSPDGLYKTIVPVGGSEASQLQSLGWIVGDTGTQSLDYQSAIQKATAKNVVLPESSISGQADFRGDGAFIKFLEDPDGPGPQSASTVYYLDTESKTLRPILSEAAFNNYFKEKLSDVQARGGIVTVPMASINAGNILAGYTLLKDNEGIGSGNEFTAPKASPVTVDSTKLASRYGKPKDEQLERVSLKQIDGLFTLLKSDPNSGISSAVIDEISNNPDIMGLYINAYSYGGYSPDDIIRDLKRQQLIKDGKTDFNSMRVIDESTIASQYYADPKNSGIKTNADLLVPKYIAGIDSSLLEGTIFQTPSELYQILVPPFDWKSPEGQAEMDKIKSAFYDVSMQQLQAETERDKAVADQTYKQLQEDVKRAYGINLSNSSQEAWNQISSLGQTSSNLGLGQSGLLRESQTKYLESRRRADEQLRQEKMTTEEKNKMNYYLNSASPQEIALLTPEEKKKYGLMPSDEIKQFFTTENLKSKYPNLSDSEIEAYRNSIIDWSNPELPTYRSSLYQSSAQKKLDLEQKKRLYQLGGVQMDQSGNITTAYGVLGKKALEEEERYREFDETPSIPYQEKPETAINL